MMIKKNSITVGIPFYKKTNVEYFDIAIQSIIDQTVSVDNIHLIQDGEVDELLTKIVTIVFLHSCIDLLNREI